MDAGTEDDQRFDLSVFSTETPGYDEVLQARESRVAMVREFLSEVTADQLAVTRKNPHAPEFAESTRSCIHVILEEEWEHHRYAVRDLARIEKDGAGVGSA
jgi:hypothetical protein